MFVKSFFGHFDFFQDKVYRQRLVPKFKECRQFLSNPDVTKYPFVLVFSTKDICEQRENGLKKCTVVWFLKIKLMRFEIILA